MSTAAAARPELAGVRVRKRKKDIKAKYEPEAFRDSLLDDVILDENGAPLPLETIKQNLDSAGEKLDYQRYGEILFDVLFTGNMLAAGGGYQTNDPADFSPICIFKAEESVEGVRKYLDIFSMIIRRYRYLQATFEESIKKILRFLNKFDQAEVNKLGICLSLFFSVQLCPMTVLSTLFMEHLVKEGHSLQFITLVFKTYLEISTMEHLSGNLKKNNLEDKLLEFFPPSKRNGEFFLRHFKAEGLDKLVDFHARKMNSIARDNLRNLLVDSLKNATISIPDIITQTKTHVTANDISEVELVSIIWDGLMTSVEWARKAEQCEEQAMKVVTDRIKILSSFATSPKAEMALLNTVQTYCYQDQRVNKVFGKLVTILYNGGVVSENAIIHWNNKGGSSHGKAVFSKQAQPLIEWLKQAEEEE